MKLWSWRKSKGYQRVPLKQNKNNSKVSKDEKQILNAWKVFEIIIKTVVYKYLPGNSWGQESLNVMKVQLSNLICD